jgi:hypothetical protein
MCESREVDMRRMTWVVLLAAASLCLGIAQPAHAQLASRSAEEWIRTLESPQRIAGLKVDETLAALHLKAGDVVADIGAGSGIFEAPLAQAVSPRGMVYAVDIEQGLVDHIAQRAGEMHLANVQGVLGKFTDPSLARVDQRRASSHPGSCGVSEKSCQLSQAVRPRGRHRVRSGARRAQEPAGAADYIAAGHCLDGRRRVGAG